MKKIFKVLCLILSLILVAIIAFIDSITGYNITLMIFYIIPVAFAAWAIGNSAGVLMAILSGIAWFVADLASGHPYPNAAEPFWNALVRTFFFLFPVYLIERRRKAMTLQKSEVWFSTTLRSIGDAVIATDINGRVTFINAVASKMTGWGQREALGKPLEEIFSIVNEETGEAAENPVTRVMREGIIIGLGNHTLLISKDGTRFPIDDSAAPMRDKEGDIFGVVLVFRDITERRKSEQALAASEANYRSIFELANDAIIIRDMETLEAIDVNKKACEMLVCAKEQIINSSPRKFMADEPPYTWENVLQFYAKAGAGEPQLFEWLAKDTAERVFWVEANISRAVIGGRYRFVSVLRDISERKELIKTKEDFINTVSHELRTPLSALRESISLVLEGGMGKLSEKQQEILYISKRSVNRLARLIDQVLDLQKIDLGKEELAFEKNDINDVAKEVHKVMIPVADKKGLALTLKIDDNMPRIDFDKDKILGVLTNLVDNALKYTEKGTVVVTTVREGNVIRVSVSDTGGGIKEEDMPKLFQRFTQIKRRSGGSGLGLAICKEIIEKHKGKIWAESEFGKGTTFHFVLPIKERRR